ncbi:colicin transporter [Sphingobium limneticum]|uniref:Colicin transporter n=1 Tax=Sphingobium limneticum TaxID=1007511 RepID=A0A5J5I3N5_9SPHN|nr:colicin transporter [Sphingobium limneticum]KAA9016789.1 colicin transporter [Sphingobium limneticum]KAA9029768.1 colicin transporter [Sphingobium limneticum]
MIAVKRLQSLIWVILVALGALGAYMVSLKVATERNELMKVRAQIARTKADIRYLETEFSARASMRQLERWNQDDFMYSTPSAQQYLGGERALAHLDGVQPNGPDYVAPPVMVAMVETPADLPSAPQKAPESPAATQIRSDIAVIREAHAADAVDKLPKSAPRTPAQQAKADADVSKPNPIARKAERMAMLDAKLLDDSTLGDLSAKAAREKRKEAR